MVRSICTQQLGNTGIGCRNKYFTSFCILATNAELYALPGFGRKLAEQIFGSPNGAAASEIR